MAVTGNGATLYVAALGSDKVGVFSTGQLENNTFVPSTANQIHVSGGGPTGIVLDENWPLPRQRAVVAATADLYRTRGTPTGLRRHIELVTGGQVEIAESGGVRWSTTPTPADASVPAGSADDQGSWVSVRVTVSDPDQINVRALDSLIGAIKPAHVIHGLEVAGS